MGLIGQLGRGSVDLDEMKRLATAGLTALLLLALFPAAGEIVENALHFVQEGHAAHADPDGDDHDPAGPEHGCTDVVHLCSCCAGLSVLPTRLAGIAPIHQSEAPVALVSTPIPDYSGHGLYRPPRS